MPNYHAPSSCPVCGQTMEVTRLRCVKCDTELTGKFAPCRFCMLDDKYMNFVEVFLRCRGNIKEVEKALGVSYPTVRNLMEASLAALGLSGRPQPPSQEEQQREGILEKLLKKEIDVDAAITALRNMKGENGNE